jgi:hypothetical protein
MENKHNTENLTNLLYIGDNYIKIRRQMDLSLTIIIVLFGIIGNIFVILIMYLNKNLLKITTTIYLIALAISDIFVLVFEDLIIWIDFLIADDNHKIQTITDCKIYYIYYVSKTLSAWLIVSISFDRFISVYFPQKCKKYLTKEYSLVRITVLIFFSIFINIHYVLLIHAPKNFEYDCIENDHGGIWNEKVWPIINTFVYSAIPSLLLIIFNTLIIYKLTITKFNLNKVHFYDKDAVETSSRRGGCVYHYLTILNANKQLNITVFAICISFLILTLPSNLYTIYNNGDILNGDVYHENFVINFTSDVLEFVETRNHVLKVLLIDRILEQMMNLYHAINFILYVITSTVFRKQFLVIICNFRKFFIKNI